jgi:hypothetical protein
VKATTLLVCQHRALADRVSELAINKELRVPQLLRLVGELMAHIAIEGHFFYDDIRAPLAIDLDHNFTLHLRLKNALRQLVHAEADDRAFARALEALQSALAAHVDADEAHLIPAAEERLRPDALESLGARMARFYAEAVPEK